ncbi:hypothetical protein Tco_1533259 [Tanacetum coccineum]
MVITAFSFAKSRPNGKLIYNSIMNGSYVRRMIPEPGDPARTVPVPETFHEQTDDELTEAEIKQMEADDQAIQTILLGLPEDIYAAVDSCETAQKIWLRVQQMMKGSDIGIQEKKAKLFNEWEMFTSTDGESIESYYHRLSKLMNDFKRNKHFPEKIDNPLALMANSNNSFKYPVFHPDLPSSNTYIQQPLPNNNNYNPQPSFNQNYMQQPMPNLEDITDPTTVINMVLALMAKAFKLNYSTPTNNNQRISSNPRNRQIAQPANKSLAKHKALELEIERLFRAVISQDIMSIMQNPSVVDSSNLQTELERTKERFENCIIKKENEYAKLWNDWYKKCEECKYDKISYDKAYNDMQQKIERLQAQLGDQKGKSKDTPCVSNTLDPLSQKLENENVELEFQVRNYEKENAHLKTTYKNLFDSISVTRAQTKTIIDSLQDKLHDTIYENAKLRAQLFDKVSEQKDTTKGTSVNTQFCKQSILGKPPSSSKPKLYAVTPFPKSKGLPKIDKTHALSKPVTSNSVPTPQESKVVKNDNVIAPGMFRINPFKPSREEKYVPNKVRASVRTNPITVSQPHVITKKDVNSDSNGLSSTGVDNTAKTRRPQPRSNTKNDRVPSASKSSCNKNKEVEVEEHHRNLLLSKNKKHMSSECKHVKLDIGQ